MHRAVITQYDSAATLILDLQMGDIIEFLDSKIGEKLREFRLSPDGSETEILYTYVNDFAVYIGEQDGDHYVSCMCGPTIVRRKLTDVADGRLCRLNNALDLLVEPKTSEIIVGAAMNLEDIPKISFENSQLFATYCRYPKEHLLQEHLPSFKRIARIIHYEFDDDATAYGSSNCEEHIERQLRRDGILPGDRKWHNIDDLVKELAIGDMVEFKRSNYKHWGVYVGRPFGVHMIVHKLQTTKTGSSALLNASTSAQSATSFTGNEIRQEPLTAVAEGGLCRINNMVNWWRPKPRPGLEIVENAFAFLKGDQRKQYNVVIKNCEHFACLCRYGNEKSTQIDDIIHIGLVCVTAAMRVASYWIPSLNSFPMYFLIMAHGVYIGFAGHFPPGFRHICERLIPAVAIGVYDRVRKVIRRLLKSFQGKGSEQVPIKSDDGRRELYLLNQLTSEPGDLTDYSVRALYQFNYSLKGIGRFIAHSLYVVLYGYLIFF